ncbi:FAD-dependent oxidoreductase [Caviibacter abscessus]|uniref:FAD-dependent oxidoreductase n=1 Tax=Caviibacter abscessus TaxID=1766719 RepID=UPI00082DB2E2|nr:FAD-dependent oxidoreductase [Caviibacter abscessus]
MQGLNLDLNSKKFANMDNKTYYDVIVIGAGPAAMSAAIYSIRKGLVTGIIGDIIGGQVTTTNEIENIIGIPKTTGSDFSLSLEKHAKEYEIPFYKGHIVKEIKVDVKDKIVISDDNISFRTKTVIIATGAKHRELNVEGEKEYIGKGVHYCSTCDGPFYRNLNVVVVGGGNSGVEAALDLSNIAKSVILMEFMPSLKADKVLQEKLYENNKITVMPNTKIEKISGTQFVTNLEFVDRETNETKIIDTDGIFVEIGLIANTDPFKNLVDVNKAGEIIIDNSNMTNVPGIFAAGDCTTVLHKQIIISMGEGAKAALSAFNYILNN